MNNKNNDILRFDDGHLKLYTQKDILVKHFGSFIDGVEHAILYLGEDITPYQSRIIRTARRWHVRSRLNTILDMCTTEQMYKIEDLIHEWSDEGKL